MTLSLDALLLAFFIPSTRCQLTGIPRNKQLLRLLLTVPNLLLPTCVLTKLLTSILLCTIWVCTSMRNITSLATTKWSLISSTLLHAKLHKWHNALSFHCIHEAVATKFITMYHLDGIFSPANILSKHWCFPQVWHNLKRLLFYQGDTVDLYHAD